MHHKTKRLKKILLTILVIFVVYCLFDRYTGKKCYLDVPGGVLIFQFTGKITSSFLSDNCSAEIEVLHANFKYSPFTRQLKTSSTGCWYDDFCPSIMQHENHIIGFHNFYSNDGGETFISLGEMLQQIYEQHDEYLSGAKYLSINKDELIITNNRDDRIFLTCDGGVSWKEISQIEQ